MPVQPAAPVDVPGLIEAYRTTLTSFADVCEGVREQEWDQPTSCPGWSLKDHLAHVLHVEDVLAGAPHPGGEGPAEGAEISVGSPAHVRNPFTAWCEEGVAARRDRPARELVAELRGVIELRTAQMYAPDLTVDTIVPSTKGRVLEFGRLTLLRIADVWGHEQDLRDTLGRPGSLDTVGASAFVTLVEEELTDAVVQHAEPAPGSTVIIDVTGPLHARMGLRVHADEQGDLVGTPLFTGQPVPEGEVAEDGTTTTIALSTQMLARRAAGRRPTAETPRTVTGDEALAERVLDALVITP